MHVNVYAYEAVTNIEVIERESRDDGRTYRGLRIHLSQPDWLGNGNSNAVTFWGRHVGLMLKHALDTWTAFEAERDDRDPPDAHTVGEIGAVPQAAAGVQAGTSAARDTELAAMRAAVASRVLLECSAERRACENIFARLQSLFGEVVEERDANRALANAAAAHEQRALAAATRADQIAERVEVAFRRLTDSARRLADPALDRG